MGAEGNRLFRFGNRRNVFLPVRPDGYAESAFLPEGPPKRIPVLINEIPEVVSDGVGTALR